MMTENWLLSLAACVYSRAHGGHWKPGIKRHRYSTIFPWDPTMRKRDHTNSESVAETPYECCPSTLELIMPLGGVSKTGRILELYRHQNSTQTFYQTSCKEGVRDRPCRFVKEKFRKDSICKQRYSYTYALVRDYNSQEPWRLDYIRVRSGCSCEIRVKDHHLGRRRIRMGEDDEDFF